MATNPNLGSASALPPLDVLLSAIPSLPRPVLDRLTARLIDRLDELDGDTDLEETDAEDSFQLSWYASGQDGPGCPVSDPGDNYDECEIDHEDGPGFPEAIDQRLPGERLQ